MPDVASTLCSIARWKYLITSDLTSAFYQIPLSKSSMKYCRVATPYRGVRVYTRCAMGMPGSETALEELMFRVLGNCIQDGIVAKLADDLYCGGNTLDELLSNWKRVLDVLQKFNLKLSPSKKVICPIYHYTWLDLDSRSVISQSTQSCCISQMSPSWHCPWVTLFYRCL